MDNDLTVVNDEWTSLPPARVMKLKHNTYIWQERFKQNLNRRYRLRDFSNLLHSELVLNGFVLIRHRLSFDNHRKYHIQPRTRNARRTYPVITQDDWKFIEQELIDLKYPITEVPSKRLVMVEC